MTKNKVEQTKTLGETKEMIENNFFLLLLFVPTLKYYQIAGRRRHL